MKYNIGKNWFDTFNLMRKRPIVMMPFIIIAFLEGLALEFLFFSARPPLSYIADPVIRKFFGEAFTHYPGNLIVLPKLFYYKQVAIYIFFGVFLTAVSVNIFKNIKNGLPVTAKAMIRNAINSYASFLGYGILSSVLIFALRSGQLFLLSKAANRLSMYLPQAFSSTYNIFAVMSLFLTNLILQTLLIATIPLMVMEKLPLLKALWKSILTGVYNFFNIIVLIVLPFFIYLPLMLLKNFSAGLADAVFPEINVYISALGIIMSLFLDCFSILCVSQFILDKGKETRKKEA